MTLAYAIIITAAMAIIARLITFRRTGRYRPGVSLIAWLIIVLVTTLATFGPPPSEAVRWLIAAVMVALAIALIRTDGNVARLIRPLWRQ